MRVNVDNFNAAETAAMFDSIAAMAGGTNRWFHYRHPTSADKQPIVRMNRDTLYSTALVDLRQGAEVTIPEAGERYLSVMVVNAEHYINSILREPGTHRLTLADQGTPVVLLAARIFVDPDDADDVAAVNRLQDALVVEAGSPGPFTHPEYDSATRDETRTALAALGRGLAGTRRMFGRREDVDPVRHLIGTAVGWGGLPETEAYYVLATEPRPVGSFTLTFADVPVDAFWSVTVYNRDGYLDADPSGAYGVNSVTAVPEADGTVVVNLRPEADGLPNHVRVMDGWNYGLRLYRPQASVLDGSWTPPEPVPAR